MQEFVLPALENTVVEGFDKRVLLAGLYAAHSVCVVKPIGASLLFRLVHERLTGSVDTAAGACHHLDEIEMLAALYALNEFFGVSETAFKYLLLSFFRKHAENVSTKGIITPEVIKFNIKMNKNERKITYCGQNEKNAVQ